MHVALLVLHFFLIFGISARNCGIPEKPANGFITPDKANYSEGENVKYYCHRSYYSLFDSVLMNESIRICQCNGIWNGILLTCEYSAAVQSISLAGSTLMEVQNLVDYNDQTCGKLTAPLSSTSLWLDVNLRREVQQFYLRISFGEKDVQQMTTVTVRERNQSIACYRHTVLKSQRTLIAQCSVVHPVSRNMYLQFDMPKEFVYTKISICSLEVLVQTRQSCGTPDRPLNGLSDLVKDQNSVSYHCHRGYSLQGSNISECFRTIDNGNRWVTKQPPVCVLDAETNIENGRMTFTQPSCPNDNNMFHPSDIATIHCNEGFCNGTQNTIAYCNTLTNWMWTSNFVDTRPLPQGNECIPCDTHIGTTIGSALGIYSFGLSIALIAIGVLLTFLNLTYFVYRYCQKNAITVLNREEDEGTDCIYETLSEAESYVNQRLNVVLLNVQNPRTNRMPSSPIDPIIYDEIQEHPQVHQSNSGNPNWQNNPFYSIAAANAQGMPNDVKNSEQDLYRNVDYLYTDVIPA